MKKSNSILIVLLILASTGAARNAIAATGRFIGAAAPQDQAGDKKGDALKKYLEAQRLEKAGNLNGAIDAYKEAIKLDPGSAELQVALGKLYLKNRNFIDAETQAREALKLAPGSAEAQKLLASVLVAQTFVGTSIDKDKAQSAIKELEKVVNSAADAKVQMGNEDVPALAVIGEIYMRLGDNDKARESFKRLTQSDSNSDRAFFVLAGMYFQDNKFREAADAARKAYNIHQTPEYAALLARCLLNIGQTQESLELYKKALGIKDDGGVTKDSDEAKAALLTSPAIFEYARALVVAGRYDEATKLMDPIVKHAAKESDAYLRATEIQVDALRRSGKRDEAVKTLQTALEGQDVSASLGLLYALAETYGEMQQFDKAVGTYEEAVKGILNPDGTVSSNPQDRQNVALILAREAVAYRNAGKKDKAMETFDRMKKILGPDNPQPDELIVDSYLQDGKYKEAVEASNSAITRFPDERQFKFDLAEASGRVGDMKTSEATLRSMLKNTSEDAQVLAFLANVQYESNMLKEAEDNARKASELDPKSVDALVTLSIVLEREKKFKDSEAALRKALEIDPDNPTLLNNLGYYLTERNEHIQEAEQLIHRAVNIAPTNGSFLDSLGWFYFKQGNTDEAKKYLEQALVYSPRSGTIHDHVGDLSKKMGQMDRARTEWESAVKLSTDQEEIKKIKEKLDKNK